MSVFRGKGGGEGREWGGMGVGSDGMVRDRGGIGTGVVRDGGGAGRGWCGTGWGGTGAVRNGGGAGRGWCGTGVVRDGVVVRDGGGGAAYTTENTVYMCASYSLIVIGLTVSLV